MSPDRRAVLKGLGAGAVVAGGGLVAWRLVDDDENSAATTTTDPLPPEPASSLRDALVAVGSRYLEEHPDEADREVLLDALPALNDQVPERPGQALRVLAPQVEADAVAGDLVALDGWVLSVTECRAAALYAL